MQPGGVKALAARLLGASVVLIDLAAGLGLLSGAAVALFIGKFMLAAVLGVALLGIVRRFVGRRRREPAATGQRPVRWHWWLAFSAAMLLPWGVVMGSSAALQTWFPGVVLATYWKLFSGVVFVAGALAAVRLVLTTPQPLAVRMTVSALLLLGGVLLALAFQMQSRCGDESLYIGRQPAAQIAGCG